MVNGLGITADELKSRMKHGDPALFSRNSPSPGLGLGRSESLR